MVFEPGDEEKSNLSKTRLFGSMESGFDVPKNILSFAGDFQENSQIICNNSVYFLRKGIILFIFYYYLNYFLFYFRLFRVKCEEDHQFLIFSPNNIYCGTISN